MFVRQKGQSLNIVDLSMSFEMFYDVLQECVNCDGLAR